MNRRRARDLDDPEQALPPGDRPLGPLFDQRWPETSKVGDSEQRGLELPESNEAKYRTWRGTAEGQAAFRWLATSACEQVAAGATKLNIDRLWWKARDTLGQSMNNTFRSLVVRELVDTHPILRGVFEMRQRRAS